MVSVCSIISLFNVPTKIKQLVPLLLNYQNAVLLSSKGEWRNFQQPLRHMASIKFFTPMACNSIHRSYSTVKTAIVQPKKRPVRRKKTINDDQLGKGNIVAYSTGEEYDLENLLQALMKDDLYSPTNLSQELGDPDDVLHVTAKYEIESQPREIFFFREGSAVFWNCSKPECLNVLKFLKGYQTNHFDEKLVQDETEYLTYTHSDIMSRTQLKRDEIIFPAGGSSGLERFAISNAIAQSVKLGIWEAHLDEYIDSMEEVTENLKAGKEIKLTQDDVLRKTGELFSLRHVTNLSSDLLDSPDVYWDRDDLENLYRRLVNYYCITKRTKVMNEKLGHCIELVELLSTHLSDKHHVRLEWMIIILIMVEVGFEILHYIDRYMVSEDSNASHPNKIVAASSVIA